MGKKIKRIRKKQKECTDHLNFAIDTVFEFIKGLIILMLRIT